jgi:hypothetical protein
MLLTTGSVHTITNNKSDRMWKEATVTYCALLLLLPGTPQLSRYDPADAGYVIKLQHAERQQKN